MISDRKWREVWKAAGRAAGITITPQILRAGVPDRFVDVFQGRAPRSVAKHYTGKGLQRLKRIYDKAGLKVLS